MLTDDKIYIKLAHQRLTKIAKFALFRHEFSIYALAYVWQLRR